jgi:arylsulfatase A-like enzyme
VPCIYVENHRVANLDPNDPIAVSYQGPLDDRPTGRTHPQLLTIKPSHGHDMTIVNGISRIGYMRGGGSALWKDETMADTLTAKAVSFLEDNRNRPFFLYFCTHDIHVPRVPHGRFARSSPMGPRGNAVAELDWCVGRILETLDRLRLTRDTLVVFSSDNGAVVDDGYQDGAVEKLGGHRPNGPFRGGKYSRFEGGTRVPFLVRWPARVTPGFSAALIGQVGLMRSLAALTGATLPPGAAPDSENLLPALLAEARKGREMLVEQAESLSLRAGSWKYIAPGKGPQRNANVDIETGADPMPQLYYLASDPGETRNLAARNPDRVSTMAEALRRIQYR